MSGSVWGAHAQRNKDAMCLEHFLALEGMQGYQFASTYVCRVGARVCMSVHMMTMQGTGWRAHDCDLVSDTDIQQRRVCL